jgi:hypothetical protein
MEVPDPEISIPAAISGPRTRAGTFTPTHVAAHADEPGGDPRGTVIPLPDNLTDRATIVGLIVGVTVPLSAGGGPLLDGLRRGCF